MRKGVGCYRVASERGRGERETEMQKEKGGREEERERERQKRSVGPFLRRSRNDSC